MANISEDSVRNHHLSLPTYREMFLYTLIKNNYCCNYQTFFFFVVLVTTAP